jgi:TolB-like protein
VNIAARIESIAPVGGVCVSKNVYDELVNKEGVDGVTLGLQSLKGVGRLIEVFGLRGDKLNEPNPKDYQNNKISVHSDDEVPSVAIIPFRNKGKKEDEFYAYGICADLISDCSSAGLIRVASLERVEELDDIPIEEKVKQLDVRYITSGTLWKMNDMFQLSIELYDTKESKIVWSDRWQEGWDNLPSIKGNLSDGLLKALDTQPKLEKKIETTNIEAYEYYLKGMYTFEKKESIQDDKIAQGLLQKSIELDNNLLIAKFVLGNIYIDTGDLDKAMELFKITIKQGKEIGDESINVNIAKYKFCY